ncbi:MAG: hypothetical protein RL596_2134 [Bacteroidota bacterium]|jgi:hypothetical protein
MKKTISEEQSNLYSKKNIQKFTSFDDANEAEAKRIANIPAIENLRTTTELIKKVYASELKAPMTKKLSFS